MDYPSDFEFFFFSRTNLLKKQVSKTFLQQVFTFEQNDEIDFIEFFNAIKANENPQIKSGIKPAEEFRGLLKGFWKIHYYHPNFLWQNIGSDFGFVSGEKSKQFDKIYFSIFLRKDISIQEKSTMLADEFVIRPIQRRFEKNNLTGEWIVFKKFESKNYYLSLGFHDQTNEELLNLLNNIVNTEFSFFNSAV